MTFLMLHGKNVKFMKKIESVKYSKKQLFKIKIPFFIKNSIITP